MVVGEKVVFAVRCSCRQETGTCNAEASAERGNAASGNLLAMVKQAQQAQQDAHSSGSSSCSGSSSISQSPSHGIDQLLMIKRAAIDSGMAPAASGGAASLRRGSRPGLASWSAAADRLPQVGSAPAEARPRSSASASQLQSQILQLFAEAKSAKEAGARPPP